MTVTLEQAIAAMTALYHASDHNNHCPTNHDGDASRCDCGLSEAERLAEAVMLGLPLVNESTAQLEAELAEARGEVLAWERHAAESVAREREACAHLAGVDAMGWAWSGDESAVTVCLAVADAIRARRKP